MNEVNLEKMACFLYTLGAKQFNFADVVYESGQDEHGETCGTICCAIGWTPAVFPELAHWVVPEQTGNLTVSADGETEIDYITLARQIFDISEVDARYMFTPNCGTSSPSEEAWFASIGEYDSAYAILYSGATPKQLAKNIRIFINYTKQKETK